MDGCCIRLIRKRRMLLSSLNPQRDLLDLLNRAFKTWRTTFSLRQYKFHIKLTNENDAVAPRGTWTEPSSAFV